jgi:pimeloyl-ACP methyl ester carboxylesterase
VRSRDYVLGLTPEVRYAKSADVMVAYQVTGEGNPIDLIWAPGVVSHLDLDWEYPEWASFLRSLGAFARLIRFDKRGTGLSDRGINAATLEERTDDIRAVMDAAGSERAVIAGDSEGGCMACVFAATYPERTRGLVLWGTQARWVQTDDYPWGYPLEDSERFAREFSEEGMTLEYRDRSPPRDLHPHHRRWPAGNVRRADSCRALRSRHRRRPAPARNRDPRRLPHRRDPVRGR